MTQTDAHTNIYSIFRDKLSLLRELVFRDNLSLLRELVL
jgi:hypothetical protein